MPNIPSIVGWIAIILVVVLAAAMIYLNNSKHKPKYDETVVKVKKKGIDILSK